MIHPAVEEAWMQRKSFPRQKDRVKYTDSHFGSKEPEEIHQGIPFCKGCTHVLCLDLGSSSCGGRCYL